MSGYVARRVGQLVPVLLIVSAVVFFVFRIVPAFPVDAADLMVVPQNFDATNPVGAGPFAFVEWVRNQRVRLKKFPGYYERGLPYLDELVFMPTPDEDQKIVLLQTGGVEFSDTVPLPRVKEVRAMSNVQVFSLTPGVSPSAYVMLLNHTKSPLGDTRVRQAMNYAIDRAALLDVTFGVHDDAPAPVPGTVVEAWRSQRLLDGPDGHLEFEDRLDKATLYELAAHDYDLLAQPWGSFALGGQSPAVWVDDDGRLFAAPDPRRHGAAAAL